MKLTVPAFLLLAISPMASHGAKLVEFGCRVMISDQGEMSALQTPELRVLDYNDDNQFVGFQAIGGFKPTAVLCVRSSVIPAPHDYQIVLGGFPFFIRVDRRIAVLETPGGKYALRVVEGAPLTAAEQRAVDKRLLGYPFVLPTPKPLPRRGRVKAML